MFRYKNRLFDAWIRDRQRVWVHSEDGLMLVGHLHSYDAIGMAVIDASDGEPDLRWLPYHNVMEIGAVPIDAMQPGAATHEV